MKFERETKTLTLPKTGCVVVLNGYITGAERRKIEAVYLGAMQIESKATGATREITTGGVDGSISHKMQDEAIKAVVVSLSLEGEVVCDGEQILATLLALPDADYAEVMRAVNQVTDPKAD